LDAPWLFKDGEACRRIASSEMLASLVSLWLFVDPKADAFQEGGIGLSGETDNAGNAFILQRMCTTKLPVGPVLLELAKFMYTNNLFFNLYWLPRERNELADALTNSDFSAFNTRARVALTWRNVEDAFPDLAKFAALHEELEDTVGRLKDAKAAKRLAEQASVGERRVKRKVKRVEKEPW
jgi:ATP phosphoribosyltransferase regulatory subunit HisZ